MKELNSTDDNIPSNISPNQILVPSSKAHVTSAAPFEHWKKEKGIWSPALPKSHENGHTNAGISSREKNSSLVQLSKSTASLRPNLVNTRPRTSDSALPAPARSQVRTPGSPAFMRSETQLPGGSLSPPGRERATPMIDAQLSRPPPHVSRLASKSQLKQKQKERMRF